MQIIKSPIITKTRKLGFWETVCKFGHDYFHGTGNIVSIAKISGHISPENIIKNLSLLFNRHPLLQATIKEVAYELFFDLTAKFSDIPINVVTNSDQDAWKHYAEKESVQRFPVEKYLWRVVLISTCDQDHEIIITYHHAIADGLSTMQLIKELLTLCSLKDAKLQFLSPLPLMPPIEPMLAQQNPWAVFLQHKANIKKIVLDHWYYQNFLPVKQRQTRNIYQEVLPEQLERFHKICRTQKVTINAALNAAMLITAQRIKGQTLNTSLHTPVNLRQYTHPKLTEEHLGCYISMVTTVHENIHADINFWQLAHAYREQLNQNIPKIGFCPSDFHIANFDIESLTDLFDMPGSTRRDYFSAGFGITNLGSINLPIEFGATQLKYFMFYTNRAMGDYVIFLHVLTIQNYMYLCFSYTEPLINPAWAEQFVKMFMQTLLDSIK